MAPLQWTIQSANFTVVGHFNPAILNPDFILRECRLDLGEPLQVTSPELPAVSEIRYQSVRWFMDLNRMIVENTDLERVEDFSTPPMAINYLNVLAYTPLRLAGINLIAGIQTPNLGVAWQNFAEPEQLRPIMNRFDATNVEIISKVSLADNAVAPEEGIVSCSVPGDAFIRIRISRTEQESVANVHCNWEVRDLLAGRQRLDLISQRYLHDTRKMVSIVEALSGETT